MKKIIAFFTFITICISAAYGFKKEKMELEAVIDSMKLNITKQLLIFPHEKIHLHTDKSYYITGEKIFFRAFLLDAVTHKTADISRYVYVELINPVDSVVSRLKIRQDENHLFYGAIRLPEDLPQGVYIIRAYTQYMRNQGVSSFFSKQVKISDPQILSVQIESDFQFNGEGKINTSLRFINATTKKVIRPQSVTLRLNQDRSLTGKPDSEGWIRLRLNVSAKSSLRTLYVEMKENNLFFRQYLKIPYPEGEFDVSFYPEGGQMIEGQLSNVAFKAVNTAGQSLDITGEVVDSKGNIVSEFKTVHEGMGDFNIVPQPGKHYQAICYNGDRKLRFDLPEIQKNTLALKTNIFDNKLWITINKSDSISFSDLYVIIHSRGLIVYAEKWDSTKNLLVCDRSLFPTGISHIMLLTKEYRIVSERLVFMLNDENGLAEFKTKKDFYVKRDRIPAAIRLMDKEQQPIKGNFSIAVTSDMEVIPDTTFGIFSGILLLSELRGHIENPEYYFQRGNKDVVQAADLLMRTNGWTRYAISDIVKGKFTFPEIPVETSQKFSGIVKSGLFSKPVKDFNVSLISLKEAFFDVTKTDENGHFVFQNFEFPDSTLYWIQALNSKGKGGQMIELYVKNDTFPDVSTAWSRIPTDDKKNSSIFIDYVTKADRHYLYENGIRIIQLPEIQVKGIKQEKYKSSYYVEPDNSFTSEEIENTGALEVTDLLYRIPGVVVNGNSIRIRNATGPPLIVIDDIQYDSNDDDQTTVENLNLVTIFNIGQIDVLKNVSNLAMYGSRGANGVIVIYTKKGEIYKPAPSPNIKSLTPLGYQAPVEFYSPKYDSKESIEDSKPDLRTTIFWKPNVLTDEEGNVELDFYSADDSSTYSVIIEGISDDGKLVHYLGRSVITVK